MVTDRYNNLIRIARSNSGVYEVYKPFFSYFDSFSDTEDHNIDLVLKQLHFDVKDSCGDEVSFCEILTGAKETFDFFSTDVRDTFNQLFSKIVFEQDGYAGVADYTALASPTIREGKYLNRYTSKIVTPQIFEECSKYFLSHEFIHVVKDVNYDEMKLLFTSIETIPILWEFIHSYLDSDYDVMTRVFSERYKQMLNIEALYNDSTMFLNKYSKGTIRCSDRIAQDMQLLNMETKMYLNSFYYAVAIFEKFLKNEKVVLHYINKVLSNLITTKEFIQSCSQIDFYTNDIDYLNGFEKFKSIANNEFRK